MSTLIKGLNMKYSIKVVFSVVQTVEVDAENIREAQATALDIFDISQAELCDGEILEIKQLKVNHAKI